jgi:hypothetical protein
VPDIVAFFTNGNVPLVSPALPPTIRIRRTDTGALVVTDSNMTELGDGIYRFTFASDRTLEYGIRADALVGQTTAGERYASGALSGTTDAALGLTQYLGAVWIDTGNGAAGTVVGVNGLPTNPVDNLADAVTLAASTGFRAFKIRKTAGGPLTLTGSLDDWVVEGIGDGVNIALANQDVDGTLFRNVGLSGIMNGRVSAFDCHLDGVTELAGDFFRCELENNLAMPVAGGGVLHAEDCSSHEAGTGTPNLSVAGTLANDYHFRGYKGGIEIENSDHAGTIGSLDLVAGQVILGATNTAGGVVLRGIMDVTDTSGGGFVVTRTAALSRPDIADSNWDEARSGHLAAGTTGEALNDLRGLFITEEGTAQFGGTSQIELRAGASGQANFYQNQVITIVAGTGVGQQRVIQSYSINIGQRAAFVDRPWQTVPDATSEYQIGFVAATTHSIWDVNKFSHGITDSLADVLRTRAEQADLATVLALVADLFEVFSVTSFSVVAATASTITLSTGAISIDDFYLNAAITIVAGVGVQQQRVIIAYDGATKIATIDRPWQTLPTTSSVYRIGFPSSTAHSILDALMADHELAGSVGKALTRLFGELNRTKLFFATAAISTGGRDVPANAISHMEVQVRDDSGSFPGTSYFVVFNYEPTDTAADAPRTSNTAAVAPTDGTFTSTSFPT